MIFVAVPTPTRFNKTKKEQDTVDISIVQSVLKQINDCKMHNLVIIKSTVPPGTCDRIAPDYPFIHIAFCPEFLTERNYIRDYFSQNRFIVGLDKKSIDKKIYKSMRKQIKNFISLTLNGKILLEEETLERAAEPSLFIVDRTLAETVKYTANAFLATKVSFFNEIYQFCKASNIDYDLLRSLVLLDDRINASHTQVPGPDGKPGFGGKCVVPGMKVYTDNGAKNIEDICVGDYVLGHDGQYNKVLKIYKRQVDEDICNLHIQGHGLISVTQEHPVLSIKANRKVDKTGKLSNTKIDICDEALEWAPANTLKKGDFVAIPKINQASKYEDIDEIKAFLLGVYLADGNVENRKNRPTSRRVTLAFNKSEIKYIEDIKEKIHKHCKVENIALHYPGGEAANLVFSNKHLADFFKKHGGVAHNKQLSADALNSKNIDKILRGYFCGDGSKSCGIYTVATISEKLFCDIQQCLLTLGIGFRTNIYNERTDKNNVKHKKAFYIRISRFDDIKKMSKIMEGTHKHINTQNKNLAFSRRTSWFSNKYLFIPIKNISIEKYNGTVYNLEVENSKSYTLTSGVVHNCFPKDVVGFISAMIDKDIIPRMLGASWATNLAVRPEKDRDWLSIKGASVDE